MHFLKITISFFLMFVSYGVSQAQEVELFGVARNECGLDEGPATGNSLYRVDPDTAETELIGPIGFDGVTGLAFLEGDMLVGSASGGNDPKSAILIEINPESGQASLKGVIGTAGVEGEGGRAPDLTYEMTTDTLFATCDGSCDGGDSLQTVNPATGQGTVIGPFMGGIGSPGNGLAISNTGILFHSGAGELANINRNTGAGTFIADLTLGVDIEVNALAFHPLTGELFGSTIAQHASANPRSSTLVKINTETGATTLVGDLPDCFDGIIFRTKPINIVVPTLSEWGLIAMASILGMAGFMVIRRRKVAA